jgi:hypothetical protein
LHEIENIAVRRSVRLIFTRRLLIIGERLGLGKAIVDSLLNIGYVVRVNLSHIPMPANGQMVASVPSIAGLPSFKSRPGDTNSGADPKFADQARSR